MAADLNQISSSHLKITKNCKVQWQYLKSLQNCILSLNFHADILNWRNIAENSWFNGYFREDLGKANYMHSYGSRPPPQKWFFCSFWKRYLTVPPPSFAVVYWIFFWRKNALKVVTNLLYLLYLFAVFTGQCFSKKMGTKVFLC